MMLWGAAGLLAGSGCADDDGSGPATSLTTIATSATMTAAPTTTDPGSTGTGTATDPGDPTGGPTGDPTGDSETGGEPPGLVCDGFEAASQWSLPKLGTSEEVLDDMVHDSSVGCNGLDETVTFSRLDLTGDGRLDLVVTDLCDAAGVGTSEWRVYAATDTGFAAKPISWSLPNLGTSEEVLDDLFHDSDVGCNGLPQTVTFSLMDLTGDGLVDLVVTDLCDAAGVGTTEWRVYAATATGFAAKPMSWSLPNLGTSEEVLDDLFHDSDVGCNGLPQTVTFSLQDLTNDGRADLVVTDLCDAAGVGTTEWRVYAATATGFAAKPTSWSLPDLGTSEEILDDLAHDSDVGCNGLDQTVTFSLQDLTNDGRADLVVTNLCDAAGVGTDEWRVYAATDTGFAAKWTSWSLPDLGTSDEVFDNPYHDSSEGCGGLDASLTFSQLDLTDDGRADLVVTDLCDSGGVGTDNWRIYPATDTGFASKWISWSLPDLGVSEKVLDDMFHDSSEGCASLDESLTFSRLDLTGDKRPDLVVTDLCDTAGVGSTEWRVYPATETGYAAQPLVWPLPKLGTSEEVLDDLVHDSSVGCNGLDESVTFSLTDLTGDGALDLVVTDLCDTLGVGSEFWRVYAASCTPA